jgi:hypothetical protein
LVPKFTFLWMVDFFPNAIWTELTINPPVTDCQSGTPLGEALNLG